MPKMYRRSNPTKRNSESGKAKGKMTIRERHSIYHYFMSAKGKRTNKGDSSGKSRRKRKSEKKKLKSFFNHFLLQPPSRAPDLQLFLRRHSPKNPGDLDNVTHFPTTLPQHDAITPTSAPTTPNGIGMGRSPVTLSPTPPPEPTLLPTSVFDDTNEPTVAFDGVRVVATRFEVDYDEFTALTSEFPLAEAITIEYLREFMETQFDFNFLTTLNMFRGSLITSDAQNSAATYDLSLIFDESSIDTPNVEEVDLLVFSAFQRPFVGTLISALNELPTGNSFSTTTTVTYNPETRRILL